MSRSAVGAIALAALFGACRIQPAPAPIPGSPAEIAALAGSWGGEYSYSQSGRSGTITLDITLEKDTAYGDLIMRPHRGQPLMAADAATAAHRLHAPAPDVLRIAFVRGMQGTVEGVLERYTSPECSCIVSTVFQGTVTGNTVHGQYVATDSYGLRLSGSWSVQRIVIAE